MVNVGGEILKAIPVIVFSMLKFIFGPMMGYGLKLNMITTILASIIGMMASVFLFTYFGAWLKKTIISRFFGDLDQQTGRNNRRFLAFWRRYGLAGIALLTPLLLTPIGGTLLAVSFGSPREKIIYYMLISASLWAIILSALVYTFGNNVIPEFFRPESIPEEPTFPL